MQHTVRREIMPDVFLTSVQTDRFCTGLFSIQFLRPLSEQAAGEMALLPGLLRRGNAAYPSMELLSARLDELYGARIEPTVRKRGETLAAGFVCDAVDGSLITDDTLDTELIKLVCSLLTDPLVKNGAFDADLFESERRNLLDKQAALINDKVSYAARRMIQIMCENEPFSCSELGTPAAASALTPEGLYEVLCALLKSSRMEIFVSGRTGFERSAQLFTDCLSGIRRSAVSPLSCRFDRMPDSVKNVRESMDVTQGKLSMGFRTGISSADPRWPALLMANAVFGGTTASKLFVNVREKMSLCYYASSGLDKCKGVMTVNSGVSPEMFEKARDEILRQWEAVRNCDITDAEWNGAKATVLTSLQSAEDSPSLTEEFLLTGTIAGSTGGIPALIDAIKQTSPEEAAKAACGVMLDTVYFLEPKEEASNE